MAATNGGHHNGQRAPTAPTLQAPLAELGSTTVPVDAYLTRRRGLPLSAVAEVPDGALMGRSWRDLPTLAETAPDFAIALCRRGGLRRALTRCGQ
jgi:hypothetical protein